MADISMCKGTENNLCNSCYRKLAPANEYRQAYLLIIPMKEDNTCDEYWDSTGRYITKTKD